MELSSHQKVVIKAIHDYVVHLFNVGMRNLDRAKVNSLRWSRANVQANRDKVKKWRKTHSRRTYPKTENDRLYNAQWHRDNPDKHVAKAHRRRARLLGAGDSFTGEEWLSLKATYGNKCLGCGRHESVLNAAGLTLAADHVVSLFNGGAGSIDNIQPLCHGAGGCNNAKGTKNTDYRAIDKAQ